MRRYPRDGLSARRSLLDRLPLTGRARASKERLPDGLERQPLDRARPDHEQGARAHAEGEPLTLTVDMDAQRVAMEQLADACGAAVALEPATGRVLADRLLADVRPEPRRGRLREVLAQRGQAWPRRSSTGRAPGSSSRARRSRSSRCGRDRLRRLHGRERVRRLRLLHGLRQAGVQLRRPEGPEIFGRVTLAEALEHSINAVFCNIGKELGPQLVLEYVERFGFYEKPPLGDARGRARGKRSPLAAASSSLPSDPERCRSGQACVRAGAAARDPAPDGHGRGQSRTAGA